MPHAQFKREGDNLVQTLHADLFTAVLGRKKRTEHIVRKDQYHYSSPGSQNGKLLRIKGKGMPVYDRPDQHGDLLLEIHVDIPEQLTEQQKELFRQLQDSFNASNTFA